MGSQQQTYPQANEELLLAARHHAAVVKHWADLLQSFGGEQRGLIAEDVNLSALQPRVRENTAGLGEWTALSKGACMGVGAGWERRGTGRTGSLKHAPLHPGST